KLALRGNPTVIITISPDRPDEYEKDGQTGIYRFHPLNVSTAHNIGKENVLRQGLWSFLDTYSFYSYYKIRRILKKEKPDIVHLHTPVDLTLSAFDAVKSLDLPLVYSLHDFFLLCKRVVLLHPNGAVCNNDNMNPLCAVYRNFSRSIVNRSVDLVISPSRFCIDLYRKNGFFINSEHTILPNGIECGKRTDDEIIADRSARRPIFTILYSGGLTRHKGIDILIKAVRAIDNNNVKLNIVGSGGYEQELRRAAGNDNRIFFCGKCAHDDMGRFYRDADILVVPSIVYDVRPNVIPEAYCEGVPVAGAKIGGIPELIIDGRTGFLFQPGDHAGLQRILEKVIGDPRIVGELSVHCREFVKQFAMERYLDTLETVYRQTMQKHRQGIAARKKGRRDGR
ncbi:MAG: glycosyltransferase, partial [Candidatus Omnitrophica bacterium]|nr:glycosyltransferase [Candidatus Omnitrophota bacterium]